jgi:hypothetical protein
MVIWLLSDSRLFSRICDGSIGRNGRNAAATVTLNMLPKFDDVPISTSGEVAHTTTTTGHPSGSMSARSTREDADGPSIEAVPSA